MKHSGVDDARFQMVRFCGVEASMIDAVLPNEQVRMHAIWFIKYERSCTISFTTPIAFYGDYLPIVEDALSSFVCIAPSGEEEVSGADREQIQKEQIRVWIEALNGPVLVEEAECRLLEIGEPAVPALNEAQKTGTAMQRKHAARLLEMIRETAFMKNKSK